MSTDLDARAALTLLLVGLVVANVSWTAAVDNRASDVEDRIAELEREQADAAAFAGANATANDPRRVTVPLLAYNDARNAGTAVPATVVVGPSDGVFLEVTSVAHTTSFEVAIQRAWTVAGSSDVPPPHDGATVRMDVPDDWEAIGGGSAGLSFAVAFAATNPCAERTESVVMTGGLAEDGSVQTVDDVDDKAVAARERGYETVLVPPGQGVDVDGIEVVEVETFSAALPRALDLDDC